MGGAMATVYLVTAGGGDTYRVERIYLDRDQVDRFAQDYSGIAPVEQVQGEERETGPPPGPVTVRTGGRNGGHAFPSASVAVSCGTPVTASDSMTSTSTRNGGPATPCPTPR